MKLKSFFLWSLMIIGAVSCKYDDGELWNKVNDLDGRLTNIESQLTQMNTDLASVKTIAQALQNNVYVKSVSATENGYVIIFTDGTEATISNGSDGKNAPVISVGEFEGAYYWNQTIDGTTDWLLDDEGNKIPVSGQDAITPLLKVSTSGYWMISYDGGINYEDVLDAGGNPVKAIGEDGVDGSDGENGDTWFTDVTTVTKEDGTYLIVTFNGMKFELPMSFSISSLESIVEIEDNTSLGEWDKAYLTKDGYFLYRDAVESTSASASRAGSGASLSCLSYLPIDGSATINIFLSQEDKLPLQIVCGEKTLYFSYLDESKVELVYEGKIIGESSDYSLEELKALVTTTKAENLIRSLTYISELIGSKCDDIDFISKLKIVCETTIELKVDEDSDKTLELIGLSKGDDEIYTFVTEITLEYTIVIDKVYYSLAIWTGEATFKVGGFSCTLWGTIWCPSPTYNDLGTYGIVCDTDKTKLNIDEAEYSGTGMQNPTDESYGVDFRGLKPNTTYYYCAYYKFNSADHGALKFADEDATGDIVYDKAIKSFTTGDNNLNVDVVMCIDATGSMGGIIETVKTNALNFYDIFNKACVENDITLEALNTQVIAFRDKNVDGSSWFSQSEVYAMPDEKEGFNIWVNALDANGGGDIPESGLEALDAAFSKTDWGIDDGYHRQVIILWTDAPYLIGGYSDINIDNLQMKWNELPTGRRLILFAPNGNSDFNGGDWRNLDSWKNVIHDINITAGFESMDYIINAIIDEMVGPAPSTSESRTVDSSIFFRPN